MLYYVYYCKLDLGSLLFISGESILSFEICSARLCFGNLLHTHTHTYQPAFVVHDLYARTLGAIIALKRHNRISLELPHRILSDE